MDSIDSVIRDIISLLEEVAPVSLIFIRTVIYRIILVDIIRYMIDYRLRANPQMWKSGLKM